MKFFMPFLLLFSFLVKTPVKAEELPTLPLIELIILSDYVAVATLDHTNTEGFPEQLNFKNINWLKTDSDSVNNKIAVKYFSSYDFSSLLTIEGDKIKTPIDKFLLFFTQPRDGEDKYRLTISGFRAVSKNGDFMLPMQLNNPGPYHVITLNKNNPAVDTSFNFKSFFEKTKKLIARTEKVFALKNIADSEKRNNAILQWIKANLPELKEQGLWEEPWGSLREKTLQWLWFSGDDEMAWEALLLQQQIDNEWINPNMSVDTDGLRPFGTTEARNFFYEILTSDSSSKTEKILAIYQLKKSFWAGSLRWQKGAAHKNSISHAEQEKYADLLFQLTRHTDKQIKGEAALALAALVNPIVHSDVAIYQNERINKLMIEVWPTIPQGNTRRAFNSKLVRVLSEKQWEELTGNPDRILVSIYHFYYNDKDKQVNFNFRYENRKEMNCEIPTVFATQLSDDGNILQSLTFPAIAHYPKEPWDRLNSHRGMINIQLPKGAIDLGKWRFHVEGSTKREEGDIKWKTNSFLFTVSNKNQ